MATTLTLGATTLTLPADLDWPDEFAWSAVQSERTYSVAGALLIDRGVKLAGRPITLAGAVDRAWIERATALQLHAWALDPAAQFVLTYRGIPYTVAFDHTQTAPLDVQQVVPYADPAAGDYCYATLRFITL